MRVVAFVADLMDRSRLASALPGLSAAGEPAAAAGADVVVVDLTRFAAILPEIRAATPAPIVAFGPHVDDDLLGTARDAGADLVLPRSRFFRDPAAALAQVADRPTGEAGALPGE